MRFSNESRVPFRMVAVTRSVAQHNAWIDRHQIRSNETVHAWFDRTNRLLDVPRCGFHPDATTGIDELFSCDVTGSCDPHEFIGTINDGVDGLWFVSRDMKQGARVALGGAYSLYDLVIELDGPFIGQVLTEEEMLAWVAFRVMPRWYP